MPLHFDDLDVVSEAKGSSSALIVPCNMCPAATVAAREKKPFLRLLHDFLKSAPFEKYILALQDRLLEQGVRSKVFKSILPHQWFLCMWTAARQKKLHRHAKQYETVIVLGCESATETVRYSLKSTNCRVIEGMKTTGIMNTNLSLRLPCDVCFKNSRVIPLSSQKNDEHAVPTEESFRADPAIRRGVPKMLKVLG